MDLPLNHNPALKMHVDLNSCFAIIEQQANPLIRHQPVAVAAYDTPGGLVLASSYEAKALGIKLGVSVREARLIDPGVHILMPDPDKYLDAQRRFRSVLLHYTDKVVDKSVDEFLVDFSGSRAVSSGLSLEEVGRRIKADIKEALGEYVTVNVGIGPNRFLAKLAAGLNKPDGLDVITAANLRETYSTLDLIDLPGINVRYQARLNLAGIYTPLQFLDAPLDTLKKQVFKSINGFYWYLRLRGYPIDDVSFARRSFGHQYALGNKTKDRQQLAKLLMKLSEKTGRRLRKQGYQAEAIHLWLSFANHSYWHQGKKLRSHLYATQDIYAQAYRLLSRAPLPDRVTNMGVSVYDLKPLNPYQLGLFDSSRLDSRSLALAMDKVNDQFGEFTLVPALMAGMEDVILKRVAFGVVS